MTTAQSRHLRRFLEALNELVQGVTYRQRRANDIARYANLPLGKLDEVLNKAVETGLVERNADDPDLVRITVHGIAVVRGKVQR